MKFGVCVAAKISNIELIEVAEELGYDSAWVADSQMIWSDCYATLALAAQRTKRIKLGTGVAIAGTRIAPVTAAAIATINQITPGGPSSVSARATPGENLSFSAGRAAHDPTSV